MSERHTEPGKRNHPFSALVEGWTQRLWRAVKDARARAVLRSEFAHLQQAGDLDHVLSDIGLSRSEIPLVVKNHPGAARRLAEMLRRLRIEIKPASRGSAEMRAIQRTCLLCAVSGKCDHWIASRSEDDPHRFCPNGLAIDEMVISGKARYALNPQPEA